MSKRYVYKTKSLIFFVTVFDYIGYGIRKAKKLFIPMKPYSDKVNKILIVKFDHAGDVLLSTPVIKSIRKTYPHAYITLVVGPWSLGIVKENQDVNEVITYKAYWHDRSPEKRMNLRETYSLITSLRKKKYDLFFDLRGDLFSIIISFLAGIPRRIGYVWEGGGFLLTDEVKTSLDKHQVQILMDALRAIGKEPSEEFSTEMKISEKDKITANKILYAGGWNHETHIVGFHIGAGYPSKLWEPSRYAKLMNILAEKYNTQVLILGGHNDVYIYKSIKENLNFKPINVIGKTDFSETAALIERCNLFVGNDSAPVHIAAAVGTPVIVIFSAANNVNRWRPYGKNVFVITKKIDCIHCEKTFCATMDCMKAITVYEVLTKIEEIRQLWK
jgi:lipopolysaccharide heptosyltransferase II